MFWRFKDLVLGDIVDKMYRLYSVLDVTSNADIGDVYGTLFRRRTRGQV